MLNFIVPVVGRDINGARAWLQYGNFRLQPSEFMKLAVVLFCADFLSKRHKYVAVHEKVLRPMLMVLGVTAGLCGLQKDYGTALVFIAIVLSLMVFAGIPRRQLGYSIAAVGVAGALVLLKADNASKRLFAYLNLAETKRLDGYQVYQSLLSIANGGVGGTGIGSGTSKWGYVPLAYSDFVFAVIGEELGLLGTLTVCLVWLFVYRCGISVLNATSQRSFRWITGTTLLTQLALQAMANIAVVTALVPPKGVPHPFISYGGTNLLVSLVAIGLILGPAEQHTSSTDIQSNR